MGDVLAGVFARVVGPREAIGPFHASIRVEMVFEMRLASVFVATSRFAIHL
jgi:hypothetical protein